jgi:superfamily II DNA/RNA helicase
LGEKGDSNKYFFIFSVGRTARAGKSGRSISLVTENDRWLVKDIIKSSKTPVKSRVIPTGKYFNLERKMNK